MYNMQITPGGGGGVLGLIFAGYVPLASQSPYLIGQLKTPSLIVTLGQICNFCDPNIVTFYFYKLAHFLD